MFSFSNNQSDTQLYDKYMCLKISRLQCKNRFKNGFTIIEEKEIQQVVINKVDKIKTRQPLKQRFPPSSLFDQNYPQYNHKPNQLKFSPTKNKIQTRLDGSRIQNPLTYSKYSRERREKKVKEANRGSLPTKSLKEKYGEKESEEIITFEHINVNCINPHDGFIELTNTLGIFKTMGAGFYGINEHNLNTSNQVMMKRFWEPTKKWIKFQESLSPPTLMRNSKRIGNQGGTMLGCDGKWAGTVVQ